MRTRAAVLTGVGRVESMALDLPPLGATEALVQVEVTGLCGSDMAVYLGTHAYKTPPIVLGHEFSGIVRGVGSSVTSLKVGDRVCAASFSQCERCEYCLSGAIHLCRQKLNICHREWHGSFSEYVVVRENMASVLPPDIDADTGALVEPLTIALHAMRLPATLENRTVAIVGSGSIGLACLLCAKVLGAERVVCVDKGDLKRSLTLSLGADGYVDAENGDSVGQVLSHVRAGADITVVACSYPEVMSNAQRMTRPGGEVVVVSYADPDASLCLNDYLRSEISVRFSYLSNKADFEDVISWIASGRIDPNTLVTHRFSLSEVAFGVELKRAHPEDVGKVLFDLRASRQ